MENPFDIILERLNSIESEVRQLREQRGVATDVPQHGDIKWAAKYLGISTATLSRKAAAGTIAGNKPNNKDWRFQRADLDTYLQRNRKASASEIANHMQHR